MGQQVGQKAQSISWKKQQFEGQDCRGTSVAYRTKAFGRVSGSSKAAARGGNNYHMLVAVDRCRTAPSRRDLKYGRFQLPERWNVDHLRLALLNGQGFTLAERGNQRIVILQPFPAMEKRQCTVQS